MGEIAIGRWVLVLLIAILLIQACSSDSKDESQQAVDLTGQKSTNVRGLAPDGDTLELTELDGCLKVLFFSQMDCKYCREMTPRLMEMMASYSKDTAHPVVTYAYIAGSDTSGWQQYIKDIQPRAPFYTALRINQEKSAINYYGVKQTPTIFLIDDEDIIISPPLHNFDTVSVRTAKYIEANEDC